MKKLTGLLLAAVLCMPAYAAQTKNTMKMVSYFPVPYVAYDTVSANNAMDIGILNKCAMDIKKGTSNLGSSACSLYLYGDENAADLNSGLLNVTAGKLDLNSNVTNARIVSKKVQIGTDMTTFGGWLDIAAPLGKNESYDALYISSLKNTGNSFRVTSKDTGAKVNSFHMFDEISNDFPGCDGTVTWKELELGADVDNNRTFTDIYLVCDGTGVNPTPDPVCTEGSTRQSETSCGSGCGVVLEACIKGKWQGVNCVPKSGAECTPSILSQETCPDGSYRRRTCNTATCKWGAWDKECSAQDCSNAAYKASHKAECCPSAPQTDTVCYTPGPLQWSTSFNNDRNTEAIFQCNQASAFSGPAQACGLQCIGNGGSTVSDHSCDYISGSCSPRGATCVMQTTYCPTGSYGPNGKLNCNCTGGAVLSRTYKVCEQTYKKNGW